MRLLENEYFSVRFYLFYLVPCLAELVDDAVLTYQVTSTKYEKGGGLLTSSFHFVHLLLAAQVKLCIELLAFCFSLYELRNALFAVVKQKVPIVRRPSGLDANTYYIYDYLIRSTERFRNLSRASPLSMPFCSNARSISWWMMSFLAA